MVLRAMQLFLCDCGSSDYRPCIWEKTVSAAKLGQDSKTQRLGRQDSKTQTCCGLKTITKTHLAPRLKAAAPVSVGVDAGGESGGESEGGEGMKGGASGAAVSPHGREGEAKRR